MQTSQITAPARTEADLHVVITYSDFRAKGPEIGQSQGEKERNWPKTAVQIVKSTADCAAMNGVCAVPLELGSGKAFTFE